MDSELFGDIVIVDNEKAIRIHEKSHYGIIEQEKLHLSLIEALYLLEKDKIKIFKNKNQLNREEIIRIVQDKDLMPKYLVFKDLRNRGYVVKTGFKYGSEFRLYERGKSPGNGHSHYLVKVVREEQNLPLKDLSSYVRVAHGVNKKLLLAVVDDEGDITYYQIEWTRP